MYSGNKIIIEAKDISVTLGNQAIITHSDLIVEQGSYVGILGPNGSGKTTLIKALLGLIPTEEGTISLFGVPLNDFKEWNLIGYVAQRSENIGSEFPFKAVEVISMSLPPHKKNIALQALKSVGMDHKSNHLFRTLSGGERQRVLIARALAHNPKVIFLDEPTTGVDEKAEEEFFAFLRKLNKEKNITIVMISHDSHRLNQEADMLIYLNGKTICNCLEQTEAKHNK